MRVKGYEIPQAMRDEVLRRMRLHSFTASDIADVASRSVHPGERFNPYRVADRFIQEQRKAGTIEKTLPWPRWRWRK